jgi:hypothetical protein
LERCASVLTALMGIVMAEAQRSNFLNFPNFLNFYLLFAFNEKTIGTSPSSPLIR